MLIKFDNMSNFFGLFYTIFLKLNHNTKYKKNIKILYIVFFVWLSTN